MTLSPFLSGNYAPVKDECDDTPCAVSGQMPPGLRGTLYRNGSNPRFPPVEPYHWFTGDGMVHAIRIGGGQASYANRWVRTPRFRAEAEAGQALFAGFGQPLTERAADLDTGVANTHVIAHADRLLALEEAHLPMRLDARDLSTIGYDDFGGVLHGRFTGHPKHDPLTGQLVFFSYSATGRFSRGMSWGAIEQTGAVSRHEMFEAPFCSMVHDFGVTARHAVFPVLPLTGDMDRALAGGPPFAWEPGKGAYVGILRRDHGVASLTWQAVEPCFVFHVMNAYDEGEAIVMDVVEYARAPLFPGADGAPSAATPSCLARWRLDPAARSPMTREVLDDRPGEFPRLDERRAGLPYRFGYRLSAAQADDEGDAILRHDLVDGTTRRLVMQDGERPSEAVFVPRSPDSPEGDGWLLTVVWQPAHGTSSFWVLDAGAPEQGPVATVALPRRVPFGFHGSWVQQ